jgi:hypothetical protein
VRADIPDEKGFDRGKVGFQRRQMAPAKAQKRNIASGSGWVGRTWRIISQ